jgi:methanogenic corrinoid protein MtbC1
LYDGLKEEVEAAVNILLGRGWTPYKVLTEALVEGMRIVGIDFRDGILFVPEVLLAANSMKAGMFILRPLLIATGAPRLGKMVIGTVKGDIHDIGEISGRHRRAWPGHSRNVSSFNDDNALYESRHRYDEGKGHS